MLSFFMNAVILFWLSKTLASRSLSDKFSWLRRLNMSAMYASFPSQISSAAANEANAMFSLEKTENSSRSSSTRSAIFSHDNHRTCVWSKRLECSKPSSWQNFENIRDCSGQALMKFVILTHIDKDFRQRLSQMFCNKHFVMNHAVHFYNVWYFSDTSYRPWVLANHWSCSVGTYSHTSLPWQSWLLKKSQSMLKASTLVVLHCIWWQNVKSIISPPQQYRTLTKSCAWLAMSIRSSSWIEKKFVSVSQQSVLLCHLKYHLFLKWCCSTKDFL